MMEKYYKLYFYLNNEMMVENFDSFDDLDEFIINYDVEVFKIEDKIKFI